MSLKKIRVDGRHFLADFFGVDANKLTDRDTLMKILTDALREEGFWVIKESGSHKFSGGGKGVTGFVLLGQSHAAFHSYPEHRYMALDIYSCGECDPRPILKRMKQHLKPRRMSRVLYRRGRYNQEVI